ncbi:MAG: bifunctional hydroxymethylpyrimidine kinase/phosphomethylpyrimidine kinase [Bacteroidales bacterium]
MYSFVYPSALTIAGSDSGGGAGIQADLKTFSALGVYGTSVITAVTAQNTKGVCAIHSLDDKIVEAQADAVLSDIAVDAVKIGMLHSPQIILAVKRILERYKPRHIVLDPVMIATSGDALIEDSCIELIIRELFPLATVITPNTDEATYLTGISIDSVEDMESVGQKLLELGARAVLMKGGHLKGESMHDLLILPQKEAIPYNTTKIVTENTHGTGCTFSSAIAAHLAKGYELERAVSLSKNYITSAIANGADVYVGSGHGPVNHFFNPIPLIKKEKI